MTNKDTQTAISLTEMCGDSMVKMQYYGPNSLNEDGTFIPFSEQMAIISHYLHNEGTIYEKTYKKKALGLIDDIYKAKCRNEEGKVADYNEAQQYNLFSELYNVPFRPHRESKFTFIDLFAGIGGFRIACQNIGGKCVFSSEWDHNAQKTYAYNFGEIPFGDITSKAIKNMIPAKFDLLCGGFPCQAFSIAGYQKGFEDTRGTLFFDVADIIKKHRPKAVFLENVKNLKGHDKGNTFKVIKKTLEDLNYVVYDKVMNAMEYANVPQNRERIFIVCFDLEQVPNHDKFTFPEEQELKASIHSCIETNENNPKLFYGEDMKHYEELKSSIQSKDTIYQWRRVYVRENKSNVCPTLTANMGTGGHNVPLILTDDGIRKLSPKECLNFQGFPSNYQFPPYIAMSACYKQAGNSVVVPLIQKVCQQICTIISENS